MSFKPLLVTIFLGLFLPLLGQSNPPDTLRFSHQKHVDEFELECELCHATVLDSRQASDTNLPAMDVCQECHDGDTAPDDCSVCHSNEEEPATYLWKNIPQLNFSHQFHLERDFPCLTCHQDIPEVAQNRLGAAIQMSLCMTCHTTPQSSKDCQTCHRSLVGKTPVSHKTDWLRRHGLEAETSFNNDCNLCHQEEQCEACHLTRQVERRVHRTDFDYTHGQEYLTFSRDCMTCHEMPSFCSTCHENLSIMPFSHNNTLWTSTLLPGGGNHSQEARNNPEYCLLCHSEPASDPTCLRCHQ